MTGAFVRVSITVFGQVGMEVVIVMGCDGLQETPRSVRAECRRVPVWAAVARVLARLVRSVNCVDHVVLACAKGRDMGVLSASLLMR